MILVMSGLLVIIYFGMQQILQEYVLSRLQHDTESLISVVHQDQNQKWTVAPSQMSKVYDRVKSGHYYQLEIGTETISSRSLFDETMPQPSSSATNSVSYLADGPGQEIWLIWQQQVRKEDQPISILVAEDITPLRRQLLRYAIYGVIVIGLTIAVMIFLQRRTLDNSFAVFEILRQNIASVRHKETEKIGMSLPAEVIPLVNEIENLVDQLRNRISRNRHAIGNLAHELKRPLQLLSLQLEADREEEACDPLLDIKAIIERELRRAKISGSQSIGGNIDLNEEIPVMIKVLSKIYPQIKINFEYFGSTSSLNLDREDMLELIGNLLDNACKFANQTVEIQISLSPDHVKISIDDDGEGISKAEMNEIKKRGVRLDESKAGHGLGLDICWDIVNSYQGNILFSASPMGGLRVNVNLPLAVN